MKQWDEQRDDKDNFLLRILTLQTLVETSKLNFSRAKVNKKVFNPLDAKIP